MQLKRGTAALPRVPPSSSKRSYHPCCFPTSFCKVVICTFLHLEFADHIEKIGGVLANPQEKMQLKRQSVCLFSSSGKQCAVGTENQRVLVMDPERARLLVALLSSRVLAIRQQSLALLLQLTQTESGRSLIVSHLDLTRLLEALVSFLDFSDKEAVTAMGLFTDLALEERFQVWFQASLPGVLPALTGVLLEFTQFSVIETTTGGTGGGGIWMALVTGEEKLDVGGVKRDPKVSSSSALCQCIAIMGNLSAEPATRRQMTACEEFGNGCLSLMPRTKLSHSSMAEAPETPSKCEEDVDLFREVIYTLLGLLMNLCLQAPFVSELAEQGSNFTMGIWSLSRNSLHCLGPEKGSVRAAGVLSRTLSSSLKIVEEALRAGVVKKMIKFLKTGGETASRYAVKILAICTNSCHEARKEVIRLDNKLSIMMKLLSSEDEVLVGNAALCLGNCMEVPNVASSLLKTDLVQVLLRLAGSDMQKTAVQVNAGIALGKLCTAEPRYVVDWEPG
ncbi:Tetratricopeptide repeat protein 12 [Saguinus oedipus]|uniref:Tetratricopeptide repeat protein 12 n=1 Tax=Saguinus oedipus TaxID=9490 RepID=A0ABQ9URT4_SAGOE|nr:Tetratricopeptide repeat protein 12 [Saguinus oedipus]